MVLNIRTLAMATAVSAGVVFAMPATSQAMPQSGPVKVDTAKSGNIVDVRHRKWHKKRWSSRYCRYADDWRCYKRHRYSKYRHRYYERYDEPYYGYYRPYRSRPGVGIYLNID